MTASGAKTTLSLLHTIPHRTPSSLASIPSSSVLRIQHLPARWISSWRRFRHLNSQRAARRSIPELYGAARPVPSWVPPDEKMPRVHFYDKDIYGNEEHQFMVKSRADWQELEKHAKAKAQYLQHLEEEWEGPAVVLPEEERVMIKNRLKDVEQDPAHQERIRKLMVVLPDTKKLMYDWDDEERYYNKDPEFTQETSEAWFADGTKLPFVHGRLKELNTALITSYVGANPEIRELLWIAYQRAKEIPGVLESIPDDAWDMIYHSQNVRWKSNMHREEHIKIIEEDLKKVGRDGPPTKPDDINKVPEHKTESHLTEGELPKDMQLPPKFFQNKMSV
jgi:hypothetical protein